MSKKFSLFVFIFMLFNILFASGKGALTGKIRDSKTNLPISDVVIIIDDEKAVSSNEKGSYLIKDIPIGSHKVVFRKLGYKTRIKPNIIIKSDYTSVINIDLDIKPLSYQTINVKIKDEFFREVKSAPVSSKTIEIEEIRSQPSGSYDAQRVVQALPSVLTVTDQSNEIISRGGASGENLFMLDNLEIINPNHFGELNNGGGPISMIVPEYIKEIDFYAGAFPAKYGDKASSVMAVKTRNGNSHEYQTKIDLGNAGYGAMTEGPIPGEKGTFFLSYHRSFLSLISKSVGLTSVPVYQSFFGKQVVKISPSYTVTFHQLWGEDEQDDVEDRDELEPDDSPDDEDYVRCGRYIFGASLKKSSDWGLSNFTLSYSSQYWKDKTIDVDWKNETESRDDSDFDFEKESAMDNKEKYFKAKYSLYVPGTKIGDWEIGVSMNQEEVSSEKFMRPETSYVYHMEGDEVVIDDTLYNSYGDDNIMKAEVTSKKYAGYVQWEKSIKAFELNIGLRSDHFEYTGETVFAPRAGLKWNFSDQTKFSMGYGRHYQFPGYYYFTSTSSEEDPIGYETNKNLKAKYTDQYILGVSNTFAEDLKLTCEAYYKKYDNVPVRHSETTTEVKDHDYFFLNAGEGYSRGIELFLHKKVKNNYWGTLSYSLSEAKAIDQRFQDKEVEYDWDFDIRHSLTCILGYKIALMEQDWFIKNRGWMKYLWWTGVMPGDETEVSAKFKYSSGRPYTLKVYDEVNKEWDVPEDYSYNTERYPDYQRLDIHLKNIWFAGRFNFSTYFEIDNIFDRKNIYIYKYKGETGKIKKKYMFSRTIFGGFIIEF